MSVSAMSWAYGVQLDPLPKFILVTLADNANQYGFSAFAFDSLAEAVGMSEDDVAYHLEGLQQKNLIGSITNMGVQLLR